MNILFLSPIVPYPPHGGVLQRNYNIIRQMSKHFNVYLMAFIHPDILTTQSSIKKSYLELKKICSEVEYFGLWPKKSPLHKLTAFSLGLFYPKPFSVFAYRSPIFRKRMDFIIAQNHIDAVHFDTIGLASYRDTVLNKPSILVHHNIESMLMHRRAGVEKNVLKNFYLRLQAKRLGKYEQRQSIKFNYNIMMSENDAILLKASAPQSQTYIIPNGVDTDYYRPSPGNEQEALVYTGGLNMFANKDAVIFFLKRIWPTIKAKKPTCRFFIIGQDPPPELNELESKDSSIIVTGYVDDVRPYVSSASVYIVPLRVGGGTRLKVLDGLAQGKAIVSTSIGCEGIEVTHGENIVIADDPGEFAHRVIDLLENKKDRSRLGKAGRQFVKDNYSWGTIGIDIKNFYQTLVELP